ncbi:glycosyltransferase family 4 protein [Candidatus Uhrbacteria bacterium]|nr:glycosyltransferase family 4 protein [Candidatus Uhrbacteria bacterium]
MYIVIDARLYGPLGKGLGRYIERLIENLERIDTENRYSVLLCRENYDLYTPRNNRWTKVCVPVRWYTIREQCVIPWVLWRLKPDLVHFPHFNVPLIISSPSLSRGFLWRRIPFIVTIHDLILLKHPSTRSSMRSAASYWLKYLGYRIILRNALRHAKQVITVSHTVKKELEVRCQMSGVKCQVTYEACDGVEIGQLKMPDSGWLTKRGITQPYFLYVGNAYPHKNLDFLLDWFLRWSQLATSNWPLASNRRQEARSKKREAYQLVLVGTDDYFYKRLKARCQMLDARSQILFFGYATESELADLYRNATLVIYPSLEEGFGLPPLEAMRYAVPVVVSDLPVLHEILGPAATYFNPRDPESLTNAIHPLLPIVIPSQTQTVIPAPEPGSRTDGSRRLQPATEVELPNGSSTSASHRSEKISLGLAQVKKYSWRRMAEETLNIYNTHRNSKP